MSEAERDPESVKNASVNKYALARPFRARPRVIRISITAAAFDAISATMPLGSVSFEGEPDAKGGRQFWLEPRVVDRLAAMRRPGRDVILRLAKGGTTPATIFRRLQTD